MPLLTDWLTGNELAAELGVTPDRLQALAEKVVQLRKALRTVVGVPDYEAYLSRHKVIHPDVPPMNEDGILPLRHRPALRQTRHSLLLSGFWMRARRSERGPGLFLRT